MNRLQDPPKQFDKAAASYLPAATLQKFVAEKVLTVSAKYLQHLPNNQQYVVLDLGCGPGTFGYQQGQHFKDNLIISLDLSHNMLINHRPANAITAQAERIPLAANSVGMIISNLMLQWSTAKNQVLQEAHRILKPGGIMVLSTLIKPSLHELEQAYLNAGLKTNILDFLAYQDYLGLVSNTDLKLIDSQIWPKIIHATDIMELFKHFKQTGTNLPSKNKGLGSREALNKLKHTYPKNKGVLPLSYYCLVVVAQKPLLDS